MKYFIPIAIILLLIAVTSIMFYLKKKGKINGLDLYVIFSIACLVIYTIASLIIAVKSQITTDTLTACFFAFFGGEIVTCALIKIFKLKDRKEVEK